MKRQVFYSFHYKPDNWRASTIRNIGIIEGNRPASDNDWETIANGGEEEIKKWIKDQMKNRTCTVVLVGRNTANRKWINYEITEAWNSGMGVVGVYVHGLKDKDGFITNKGNNPFDFLLFKNKSTLSTRVKCYNPSGTNSKERYDWLVNNIASIIEEAIEIRNS